MEVSDGMRCNPSSAEWSIGVSGNFPVEAGFGCFFLLHPGWNACGGNLRRNNGNWPFLPAGAGGEPDCGGSPDTIACGRHGGFVGSFADDFLEVRTDILLNDMIPSEQRATLISVNSFTFSLVMIVMSTLMGSIM